MAPPAPARRPTIRDVAARAGVSQPTASLVLGRHPTARVAPATRQCVLDAAAELGYTPNRVAQALVRGRSFSLALVVPDPRNPFFADVAYGAERVAARRGYALLLVATRDRPLRETVATLRARQVDGALLEAQGAAALPADALAGLEVVLMDEPPTPIAPGVATDAVAAGRLAADHLLALGHRTLAFVGPATDVHTFRMRERGFVQRLREEGVTLASERLRRVPPTVAGGREAMRALLALRHRPTAVFCANDLVALGALKQAAAQKVAVPGELSIVGCDDIEMATLVTPELTTVAVPARELGARAARLLIDRLEGRAPAVAGQKPLPVALVRRGTAGPAPVPPTLDRAA